jgi:phospholipid-binding lipoprotein MlaA
MIPKAATKNTKIAERLSKPPDAELGTTACRLEVGDTAGWKPALRGLATLSLFICLASISTVAWAGEKAAAGPSPAPGPAVKQGEEDPFRDPFATAGEKTKPEVKISDPLEPVNRGLFQFNDKLYFWVLRPASKGYNKVAPAPLRLGIKRMFTNIKYPVRFVNNGLQGKFKEAGLETFRFVVNTTIGLGGFFDTVHDQWKVDEQSADLDQTLAVYGFKPGIYLHWPFLGPSSVRGTVGLAGDTALTPWPYIDSLALSFTISPYQTLNDTSLRLGDYESFKDAALDPYVAMRSFYYENRRGLIRDRFVAQGQGQVPGREAAEAEDQAVARRVREERAIVHRQEFSQGGLSHGTKGAEMLMQRGSSGAPPANTNYNLNFDFLRHSRTNAVEHPE